MAGRTVASATPVVIAPRPVSSARPANDSNQIIQVDAKSFCQPIDSVLWSSTDDIVLQAAALINPITATQTTGIIIDPSKADAWPYTGKMVVEGEIISWTGKVYRITRNGQAVSTVIKSYAEKVGMDEFGDFTSYYTNSFTGELGGVVRGVDNSTAIAHDVTLTNLTLSGATAESSLTLSAGALKISGGVRPDLSFERYSTAVVSIQGFPGNYNCFGTRMTVDRTSTEYTSGVGFFAGDNLQDCYLLEFNCTELQAAFPGMSQLRVFRSNGDLTNRTVIGVANFTYNAGDTLTIDGYVEADSNVVITVNGVATFSFNDTTTSSSSRRFGRLFVFSRGATIANFDYIYAYNTAANMPSLSNGRSVITGLPLSNPTAGIIRNISRAGVKGNGQLGQIAYYYDEFAPYCREMREFNVDHQEKPALNSHIFLSNTDRAFVFKKRSNPFRSKFTVVNNWNDSVVIQGDDASIVNGTTINQTIILYGQTLLEDEEQVLTNQSLGAIKKRGLSEFELQSKWIETDETANRVSANLTNMWSEPVDEVDIVIYGDPRYQPGDIVSVNYPQRDITAAAFVYYVITVDNEYDNGIKTTLTCKRVRAQ